MADRLVLHPDRLFPADPGTRRIARDLYESVAALPIISPHGHTDPRWFAENAAFADPASLLITPDHYVFRMLHSLGIGLDRLGLDPAVPVDPRDIWAIFASLYGAFAGTPSRIWLDWVFAELFDIDVRLSADTADHYFDRIADYLAQPAFKPRALFDRFGIEVLTTTESPLDPLDHHAAIAASGWPGRVTTAFRPDPVIDADQPDFRTNLNRLSAITGHDARGYRGYIDALRDRRAFFAAMGATSTDHGHPTAATADLTPDEAAALFARLASDQPADPDDAELFRAHMLTVMAGMSCDDGLVMQLHPGSYRNHSPAIFARYGRDKGADIPQRVDYVRALKPLLDRYGNDPALTLIVFTLDESSYARELAPLAGFYPALKLGPAWWFHDSPQGMRRFREQTTETAGFRNLVGFNDDTRAFLSIPARHDMARRIDCGFLAELVVTHRIDLPEAHEIAADLAYTLAKRAYKL